MYYDFFDYKYNIDYNGEDYFGVMHLVYMLICLIVIPLLSSHLRKKDKETIDKILRYSAVLLTIEEIAKITWESYWDITTGHGFNAAGILPLETCSIFLYCLWIASFGKGRVRDGALTWMSSIGIVGGISYILFTNVLKWYPFFSYGAFHSMIFHFMMVFVGVLIVWSGYYRFELPDIINGFIPHLMMSTIVVPLDYMFDWDYMLLHYAGGVPVIETAGQILAERDMPFITTMIMMSVYFVAGSMFTLLNIHIQRKLLPYQDTKNSAMVSRNSHSRWESAGYKL